MCALQHGMRLHQSCGLCYHCYLRPGNPMSVSLAWVHHTLRASLELKVTLTQPALEVPPLGLCRQGSQLRDLRASVHLSLAPGLLRWGPGSPLLRVALLCATLGDLHQMLLEKNMLAFLSMIRDSRRGAESAWGWTPSPAMNLYWPWAGVCSTLAVDSICQLGQDHLFRVSLRTLQKRSARQGYSYGLLYSNSEHLLSTKLSTFLSLSSCILTAPWMGTSVTQVTDEATPVTLSQLFLHLISSV